MKINIFLGLFCLFFNQNAQSQDLEAAVNGVKIVQLDPTRTNFSKPIGTLAQGHRLTKIPSDINGFLTVLIPAHALDSSMGYVSDKSNDVKTTEDERHIVCKTNALLVKSRPDSTSETVTDAHGRPVRLFRQYTYAATGERLRRGNSYWYEVYLPNEYSQSLGWVTNDGINKNNALEYRSTDCNSPFTQQIATDSTIFAKKGEELTLSLGEIRGTQLLTFVWYKDDEEVFEGKKNPVLIIADLEKDDEGTYICVVRNPCGSFVSRQFIVKFSK